MRPSSARAYTLLTSDDDTADSHAGSIGKAKVVTGSSATLIGRQRELGVVDGQPRHRCRRQRTTVPPRRRTGYRQDSSGSGRRRRSPPPWSGGGVGSMLGGRRCPGVLAMDPGVAIDPAPTRSGRSSRCGLRQAAASRTDRPGSGHPALVRRAGQRRHAAGAVRPVRRRGCPPPGVRGRPGMCGDSRRPARRPITTHCACCTSSPAICRTPSWW